MRSVWHRFNIGIAVRAIALLTLLVALVMDTRDQAESETTASQLVPDSFPEQPVIEIRASTDVARPGQRIGIRLSARYIENAELALLLNGATVDALPLPDSGLVELEVEVPSVGPLLLGAELRSQSGGALLARDPAAALVNVATVPSIQVVANRQSVFAESLRRGGWPVEETSPTILAGEPEAISSASMLVLDDIAVTDLPAATWREIDDSVRLEGLGMLVLGGPNSFAAGGYRESVLEELLPVISEPPDYEPSASLMFLIDVSGSMDRPTRGGNHLQIARQAVVAASKALREVDHVGLMSFDISVREHLPLAARDNHSEAITRSWPATASGGTRLIPAMTRAISALESDPNTQDILVVLTDGSVSPADLDNLASVLGASTVEVIALIVAAADNPDADPLIGLLEANAGRATRINDVLRLPALMRADVERTRPASIVEPTMFSVVAADAWMPDIGMTEIAGYSLTRPREGARVQLRSDRGDVVMASINAGAGEVIAVTSGFSNWSGDWLLSSDWPAFAGNLTRRLATRNTQEFTITVADDLSGKLDLIVERAMRDSTDSLHATLISPSQAITHLNLQPHAPGRVSASLEPDEDGKYLVILDDGAASARLHFLHKRRSTQSGTPADTDITGKGPDWSRRLTVLALLLFAGVLAWERRQV